MAGQTIDVVVSGIRSLTPRVREYLSTFADGSTLPRYAHGAHGAHVELHTTSSASEPIVRRYSLLGGEGLADDVDALEWISEAVDTNLEPQFNLTFAPDKPGLLMRRTLFAMAQAERARGF